MMHATIAFAVMPLGTVQENHVVVVGVHGVATVVGVHGVENTATADR